MDFTIKKYKSLLFSITAGGYRVLGVRNALESPIKEKVIVLRHDVDEQPKNALAMARVERDMGIHSTYYFRRVPKSDHPEIIREIASLGHEIGYHYEDLSKSNGNMDEAIKSFKENLFYFRTYYPVKTVCMHGSSSSEYDNRRIWDHLSLEECGLIGEPYLSFDFHKCFYLSDTGYAWDGGKFAVRDLVDKSCPLTFHSTDQVIEAINQGLFPSYSMILAHTLWTDNLMLWAFLHLREFFRNRVKLLSRRNSLVASLYKKLVTLYWK